MQERLAGGPYVALGISPAATPAEIRTAFLQLTKTYHPARFGYMSPELQRLSNEVFLALRAAHDSIARPARAVAAAKADRSGVFPASTPRSDRSSGTPATATPATPTPTLPSTPPAPTAQRSERSDRFPPMTGHAPPGAPPVSSGAVSSVRPTSTPSSGVRIGARPPPGPTPAPAMAARPAPAAAPAMGITGVPAAVVEQLQRGQWDAARAALTALAARNPDTPRYRALIAYARGREAQLAGRLDEARVELQDALQIDPELQLAKTALAELFTRRK